MNAHIPHQTFLGALGCISLALAGSFNLPAQSITNDLSCDRAALEAAIAQGGHYRFTCSAHIVLTNTLVAAQSFSLDSQGHEVTFSGADKVAILKIQPGIESSIRGIRFLGGRADKGGAILLTDSKLILENVTFESNLAEASLVQRIPSLGGAISMSGGTLIARRSLWLNNEAKGSDGAIVRGGFTFRYYAQRAGGGAIHNASGSVVLEDCEFLRNRAIGGTGQLFEIQHRGADAFGGAIQNNGSLALHRCTFAYNKAQGGDGLIFNDIYYTGGGQALGGAVANSGSLHATNTTWYQNQASALVVPLEQGLLGEGWAGPHRGGALYSDSLSNEISIVHATFSGNVIGESQIPQTLEGAAVFATQSPVSVLNSVFQHAPPSRNLAGSIQDGGWNVSSDHSASLVHPSSLTNVDPGLGDLGDFGGPTRTIALLPQSPARDLIPSNPLITEDQRGVSRPQGTRSDAGSWEQILDAGRSLLAIQSKPNRPVTITASSKPGDSITLWSSESIHGPWQVLTQKPANTSGIAVFEIGLSGARSFYKASTP